MPYNKSKCLILNIVLWLTLTFCFSILVIKDFANSLIGPGDIDLWEYQGFYLFKNLSFLPFPHLNLVNNQAFYPYGTNNVFQPWSFEREIFYAILYSLFGIGAWLQFYYLISILITIIGSFTLLVRDYGFVRASGAAIIIAFMNFYANNKYPHHLNYAVLHWTVLNFICDFLLVKRLVLKHHISLRFILVRILFLVLAIGQDIGYIAGFALMSFTVSICFSLILLIYRFLQHKVKLKEAFHAQFQQYLREFVAYRRICLLLISLICTFSYIYVPLVIQIFREAKSFDFTGIDNGIFFAHPARLLIPYLPFINPSQTVFDKIFSDSPESLGAGSPGWFLLIIAIIGIWQARQKFLIFIPLLIIFFLCLFYHPEYIQTLKIFPWFSFNRVGGRSTVIYSVILCLFAIHINLNIFHERKKILFSALLIFLGCIEIYTAYSFKFNYQPYLLDQNFFTYINYVKQQPGEAVLDWPFCAAGGNAVGSLDGLCPYFYQNGSIFALRRFHNKKVMGKYFGRLHPSQIEPYLQAGWHHLLVPDSLFYLEKTSPKVRCLREDEWSFFTEFYKLNDFTGINLYTDFLSESCVQEFYSRFGKPTVATKVPEAGKLSFIPKSDALSNQVNLALGSEIKFEPFLNFLESNLLDIRSRSTFISVTGLSGFEEIPPKTFRWALGAETKIVFKLKDSQSLNLSFKFENPIEAQNVLIEINGVTVDSFNNLNKGANIERRLQFQALKGINRVVFKYTDWNHNQTTFAREDDRALSVLFRRLAIQPTQETSL
ncbi:hypothetical protein QUB80_27960 [Chlorogloeopsis sp. ULAP01]|uniref:hypothetical protein n=1 Tax=Chlorogloeopsis sp. ULAP01 TaxID=3056483 RepID=UPI0025AA97B4|nr:hypothetical protein [Chlorogloeopsis sp. ULAP01]MDM9384506.1 hypothetical protein [Chlorogloeopsis sp. ULAP01]